MRTNLLINFRRDKNSVKNILENKKLRLERDAKKITIGIDACNIKVGGTLTHLIGFLKESNPSKQGFGRMVIWSSNDTLQKLPTQKWLEKKTHKWLNGSFVLAFLFQKFYLEREAKRMICDIMFVPGGVFLSSFKPFVTISQNLLPFEKKELNRYMNFKLKLKFLLLRFCQSHTFAKADGLIFLTKYARKVISQSVRIAENNTVIPHGINPLYVAEPRVQRPISNYSQRNPFKLLYVSILSPYKHQWNVAEAVCRLHAKQIPVHLTLVGPAETESLKMLNEVLQNYSNSKNAIEYKGGIPHEQLFAIYKEADSFIFGSTCENLPIILIEAMSAGLPILCSSYGPMPEVLGNNEGMYFDPLQINDIEEKIIEFLNSNIKRQKMADESFKSAVKYSWADMTADTHRFINKTYSKIKGQLSH
ncbi:MAG: glycosyltransferase [Niabella sp.]